MKNLIVLWAVALMALLLVASVGCQKQWQPEEPPSLAIMVESNIVEAGSSFMVSGLNFKSRQKVWVDFKYQASDRSEAVQAYCEADENGSIYPIFEVPEDVVPGDYEVEIYMGKNLNDRELIATFPIHIQAKAK